MKEPVKAIHKGFCFNREFIQSVRLLMVLSKRSQIHSDSFRQKFNYN